MPRIGLCRLRIYDAPAIRCQHITSGIIELQDDLEASIDKRDDRLKRENLHLPSLQSMWTVMTRNCEAEGSYDLCTT